MTLIDFVLANPFGVILGLSVAVSIIAVVYAVMAADAEGRH